MTKRVKLMILVVVFGIVMFGATMLYDYLKTTVMDADNQSSSSQSSSQSSSSQESSSQGLTSEASSQSDEIYLDDFTIEDLEGNKVSFSEFEGKAAVINFWATWCGYCKQEMPDFNDLYNIYKDEDIEFMMINVTDGNRETKEVVEKYLEGEDYDFPVYLDHQGSFYSEFGQRSLPITIVVNKEHYVVKAYVGVAPRESLEEAIKEAIK